MSIKQKSSTLFKLYEYSLHIMLCSTIKQGIIKFWNMDLKMDLNSMNYVGESKVFLNFLSWKLTFPDGFFGFVIHPTEAHASWFSPFNWIADNHFVWRSFTQKVIVNDLIGWGCFLVARRQVLLNVTVIPFEAVGQKSLQDLVAIKFVLLVSGHSSSWWLEDEFCKLQRQRFRKFEKLVNWGIV